MIVNGDFETGDLTGWLIFGESPNSGVTLDPAMSGPSGEATDTYSAFQENRVEGLGLTLKQSTAAETATGGTTWYTFDYKLDEAGPGGVFFVEIFAENLGVIGGSGLMGPLWGTEWTTVTGTFEAPAATSFFSIEFRATTGAVTGSTLLVHVDNVGISQDGPVVATEDLNWSSVKALYR